MELFNKNQECCGCGACCSICPKEAIQLYEDQNGFVYPRIDDEKCINCKLCKSVCPIQNKTQNQCGKRECVAYAAINKIESQIMTSASGGVFAGLASRAIEAGFIVWGASMKIDMNGNLNVSHERITSLIDLNKLKGSKYVQSHTGHVFNQIREDLNKNKKTLFSGTPCQIAALKRFLRGKDQGLVTIDLICHGTPNQKMLQTYFDWLSEKYNGKVSEFIFRNKKYGWGMTATALINRKSKKNKKVIIPSSNSSYYNLFLNGKIYRESCYACPYASADRVGDITIGDYWGIKKVHPEIVKNNLFKEEKGISCILVNNEVGVDFINEYGSELELFKSDVQSVSVQNAQLKHPSCKPDDYELILKEIKEHGFHRLQGSLKKNMGMRRYITNLIKAHIPSSIKGRIRQILRR